MTSPSPLEDVAHGAPLEFIFGATHRIVRLGATPQSGRLHLALSGQLAVLIGQELWRIAQIFVLKSQAFSGGELVHKGHGLGCRGHLGSRTAFVHAPRTIRAKIATLPKLRSNYAVRPSIAIW
jgi:hypothetical protein